MKNELLGKLNKKKISIIIPKYLVIGFAAKKMTMYIAINIYLL